MTIALGGFWLALLALPGAQAQNPTAPTASIDPEAIDAMWQKASSKYDGQRAALLKQVDAADRRGLYALHRDEPDAAIEQLRIAAPYELAQSRIGFFGFFGNLYPVYVRGLAYLSAHQETQAAAEFRKILDHRSIVISDPIGALASLQLGRAYALLGDTMKAKSAYQDFLALWKDADTGIPILKQAKAEYAKLP